MACHIELKWQKQTCPCVIFTQPLYTQLVRLQDCTRSKGKKFGPSLMLCVLHDLDNISFSTETTYSVPVKHSPIVAHTVTSKLHLELSCSVCGLPYDIKHNFLQSWHKTGSDIRDISQSCRVVDSPCLEVLKWCVDVAPRTWFTGGLGSARLMTGLDGLKGLLQSE